MARRRHLIAYDIANPKRLRKVIRTMESFGVRLQYSVFLCDLTRSELIGWKIGILEHIKPSEDSVVIIDLGPVGQTPIDVIGIPRTLPTQGPLIV